MALSNADNPLVEKPKTVKPEPAPEPKPVVHLAPASRSSDQAVHRILAERQTALRNKDVSALAAADQALADLGYAV